MREARGEGGKAMQGAREARRGTTGRVVPSGATDRKQISPLLAAICIIGRRRRFSIIIPRSWRNTVQEPAGGGWRAGW
jgi:hypothetical protein